VAVLLLFWLSACTITEVEQDGTRTRSISLGPAVLPQIDGGTYTIRVQGIGVALTIKNGVNLGYFNNRKVIVGRDCFAHFVVLDATEAARIMELFPDAQVCASTGG